MEMEKCFHFFYFFFYFYFNLMPIVTCAGDSQNGMSVAKRCTDKMKKEQGSSDFERVKMPNKIIAIFPK